MAVQWTNAGLYRICFGYPTRDAAQDGLSTAGSLRPWSNRKSRADQSNLQEPLQAYAEGLPVDFSDFELDLSELTPFRQRVTHECRRVGYGQRISYAELARRAGSPRGARPAGNVMARNPLPLVVPCHRIVGANDALGGFSAPDGIAMKQRLLDLEQPAHDNRTTRRH